MIIIIVTGAEANDVVWLLRQFDHAGADTEWEGSVCTASLCKHPRMLQPITVVLLRLSRQKRPEARRNTAKAAKVRLKSS